MPGLKGPDHAAGNPGTGVAGGLGGKIVRLSVDDHGASDDLRDGEPVCQDAHAGLAAAPKEGRQIPRVIGVGAVDRIQMSAGVLKIRRGAGGTVVDMKPEDPGGAGGVLIGEPVDLCGDQGAQLVGEERDKPGDRGVRPAGDMGEGGGFARRRQRQWDHLLQ